MKPTDQHYAAARTVFFELKDSGPSPTRDPERYWKGITDAVLALVPLEEWQPIATAPMDGTEILVCRWPLHGPNPHDGWGIFVHRAAWWSGENDGQGAWIVYNSMVCDPECHFDPTHWKPCPPPPATETGPLEDSYGPIASETK